jgi:protein-L-isoaspartate(D-aspartate) O-methyltransferase
MPLALTRAEKVLEVGTGYGYQTALLAKLAKAVWSIEVWEGMTNAARVSLAAEGITNVELVVGDGTRGIPEQAPFDAIVVTAAFPRASPPLADQLAHGARLVQPIGPGGLDHVVPFMKENAELVAKRSVAEAHFVHAYGEHGYPSKRPQNPEARTTSAHSERRGTGSRSSRSYTHSLRDAVPMIWRATAYDQVI